MTTESRTVSERETYFHARYGNEEYYFFLSLYNNEGYQTVLQRNALIHLEIDDNIFNPFHSANMIISNDMHILEKNSTPYVFLGNGRDIVDLEIIPIKSGNFDKDSSDEKTKEFLGLKFQFVVVECYDITYNGSTCKQLKLVEYAQFMLAENICDVFGLQKMGSSLGNPIETIGGNSIPTGEAIKSILKAVYSKDGKSATDIFYQDSNKKEVFEYDQDSRIFISPHGSMSYMEVLNYVMSFVSYQKSPCVLQFDRYQKKFQLISLKTLFKNNKEYVIETLRLPSTNTGYESQSKSIQWDVFPVTFEESRINELYINSPTTKDNILLTSNSAILSNARSYKSMIFNTTTLNSNNFIKQFIELFVDPFKKDFRDYQVLPNFRLNPNKKNNYNTFKGFLAPEMDESKFLNQKLNSMLYLNNLYQISLNGKTHRKSMSFVDITKISDTKNNGNNVTEWDLNNVGRHFITKVKHIFTFDKYVNQIETIKPYRLSDGSAKGTTLDQYLNLFK